MSVFLGAAEKEIDPIKSGAVAESLPANTWIRTEVDRSSALKDYLAEKKGRWEASDGFSDNLFRSKTGAALIRTGINCKETGLTPGFTLIQLWNGI